ncbi:MAG: HAMP domain-containing histidine kinase [Defluviitaleaceae bacterium]|nr:HAMP domain-containing histidine kinase [Defluviitaleaceae bacterium]
MILFKKLLGYIQTNIVMVFAVLLFMSFAMVGIAFHFSINLYISRSATAVLREARTSQSTETGAMWRLIQGYHEFSHTSVRYFVVDENRVPLNVFVSSEAQTIAENLNELHTVDGMRKRVNDQTFYVSLTPTRTGGAEVFYLDVTETVMFTAVVNRLLLLSVGLIWVISMVVAGFLTDFMMRPLRFFRNFVRQIGRGDFTPNTRTFANEEFEELNQSLNNAVRQLAAYDNEQKTFFQNVSHELRTPLMSIKSYAEGIKYGMMDVESASETILQATDRLTGMVEEILYVSRIDSVAAPTMEQVNLCIIVEERLRQQRSVAEDRGLELKYVSDNEPIIVNCVAYHMERAVDNLISNAIRYSKNTILVECYAIGSSATIRITDDGPGFEPSELPHVFERFYRGKNGLTGIGLSTVKSITDQHKGSATAENRKGGGAILTVSIPWRRSSNAFSALKH